MIRLLRIGKTNSPIYRVVLTEKTAAAKGKFIEILGHYNPKSKKADFKKERILYWLEKGAQKSATLNNLLIKYKIIQGQKIKIKIKKELDNK